MEYQLIYKTAPGCREIQKTIIGKDFLTAWIRSIVTEPIYRETQIVSVCEIRKTGAYRNGRRAKWLKVASLIEEAKGAK